MTADDRDLAVHERGRNVIVDASAGTGKTRLVVDRLIELVAPTDGRDPIPIDRIAAITFTRKAAGELRVRVRQRILQSLAELSPDAPRAAPLLRALGGIDTAHIGTMHGFADRLLRKWPAQARLDPRYELVEDDSALADECFQLLIRAAENRTLADLLLGSSIADRSAETSATIADVQRAGLRLRSLETEHWTYHGLDGLIAAFILQRDLDPPEPVEWEFRAIEFRRYADEYLGLVDGLSAETRGGRWLIDTAAVLRSLETETDPAILFREVVDRLERGPRGRMSDSPRKAQDFTDDSRAWDVWKALDGDERREPVRASSLRDDLLAPLRRWMASRLVRLRPVVLQLYDVVKARHQAVDHVDLLLRLRNLLRDDRVIRRSCQRLFDHIFVDEFQDTDPLQAEIVMFLCERGAEAATWDAVKLVPGALTVVGDPKQSIYRFRRADIATYQRVLEIIARSPYRSLTLARSYRSSPSLVDWLNGRFLEILGSSDHGERFRRDTGDVFHQPLTHGRASGVAPAVHAVAMDLVAGGTVAEYRALEAEVTSRYIRWLVEASGVSIIDPETGKPRAIGYGDIGVLAFTTTNLPVLFDAFDRDGIPYAARGGTLFLSDPMHRHFLLGLVALADRDDGVAAAAILRPPFFAVDLADLARSRRDDPDDRAVQARAVVRELRRRRFERSPGQTARALLEQTGLGRTIALGPNGAQRLSALRELCFQLEARAVSDHLDFDAIVEQLRGWIDRPQGLDRPHPVDGATVRAMTVHQAKGLEFPVVVLWDARATWNDRVRYDAWTAERDGRGWAMRMDLVRWEEPPGLDIAEHERQMRTTERKRLVYVAATRARDILVVPKVGAADDRWIFGRMLGTTRSPNVLEQPLHTPAAHAAWFDSVSPAMANLPHVTTTRDVELRAEWTCAATEAAREQMRPVAFTDVSTPRTWWGKKGRFGRVFGETVHVAIGLALRSAAVADAVRAASLRTGLSENLPEAIGDVTRALSTLAELGVATPLELEYPVTGVAADGQLVSGYVDLIAVVEATTILLDFKTDLPPPPSMPVPQNYADQVTGYAAVLERTLAVSIRAGLLYTADGTIRWLSFGDNARS
ncbi:MAG: UvrD-helicase domain-containing protein [Kofleriaceae bacterium]